MLKEIDHINIVVSNLETAKKFFIDILGFKIEDESLLEGDWISNVVGLENAKAMYTKLSLLNSKVNIELIQYYQPSSGKVEGNEKANQLGFRHLAFEVEKIEDVYEKLKNKDVKFFSPVQFNKKKGKKIVYFLGPDNIILELAEYTK